MIQRLKTGWRELRQGEPGRRFRGCYERRHSRARHAGGRKWSVIVAGLIAVAGIVLLPLPGPGMLVVALGAFLVAQESLTAARMLDQLELRARALIARRRPAPKQPSLPRSGSH